MGVRRKGRQVALQALYQLGVTNEASEQGLSAFWESFECSTPAKEFACGLVHGVQQRRDEIDALIAGAAEHWRVERLSRVDLNVIRIAIYEMTAAPELPVEIALNEAIELARKFGTEDSATFVNGVLDQVATQLGVKSSRRLKEVDCKQFAVDSPPRR